MNKPLLLVVFIVVALALPGFSHALSGGAYELSAGPTRAFTCGDTVSDSLTFSDEPSRFLWSITAGGMVGADDVAFIYKDGSQILVATNCGGIRSPADIKCNTACAGNTGVTWGTYFQDSGASSPDSVTFSGTAYETYEPTDLVSDVAFNGFQMSVYWQDCAAGQRVDNGRCVDITGSITPDKTSCTAPCDVGLDWSTNSYRNATITRNGTTIRTVATTSGVSNTNTSGGPVADNGLAAGNYDYCINGYDGFNDPVPRLFCRTVFVNTASGPTASLTANGSSSISVNVGDSVNYVWSSSNGTGWTSWYTVNADDACGHVAGTRYDWVARNNGGSYGGTIGSCQDGRTYTITYQVTNSVGSDTASVTVRVGSALPPPPPTGTPTPNVTLRGRSTSPTYSNGPISITSGGSVVLQWSSTDADSCTASGSWSGSKSTSGTRTISGITSNSTFRLLCSGPGGDDSDSFIARVLSVSLSANPSSGPSPLNGVDLTATVSGTSSGTYRYFFDCQNDGINERDITVSSNPYTAVDLCNYSSSATARVSVWHNEGTALATAPVTINNSPPVTSAVTVAEPNYCVSGPAAFVSWTYSDPESTPQSAYQVQVGDNGGSWTFFYSDSGKVISSGTSYFASGLPMDTTMKARVRVWDSNDLVSAWTESFSWKSPKHSYPIVNFTWSPLLDPSANQPIQFTDQTQFSPLDGNGVGQRAWNWLFGDGGSSTLQNPNHTYSANGSYNVTLTATDKDGYSCSLTKPIGIERPIPIWKEVSPK